MTRSKWRPVYLIIGSAVFAAVMLALSAFVLSRWSELSRSTKRDADSAFEDTIRDAGGGPVYMEISPHGTIRIRRELERLGPGVVLDHRLRDGSRILLWTE